MNDYFSEVGHNLIPNFDDNIYFQKYLPVRDFECFDDIEPVSLNEIKDILFEFDDLMSRCDEVFVCNHSLAGGVFPNRLMLASVVFIFKVGDPTFLKNYRPISSLNVISKLI